MGYAVDVNDYDGMADVVRRIKANPEESNRKIMNAYKYGQTYFSSTRSVGILLDVMDRYKK